jgi:NAD-dependent SIR2 family protein deacetylase
MGTSLMVQPAASFALKIADKTKSIFVNLETTIYDRTFTYTIKEDLDKFSEAVWEKLK